MQNTQKTASAKSSAIALVVLSLIDAICVIIFLVGVISAAAAAASNPYAALGAATAIAGYTLAFLIIGILLGIAVFVLKIVVGIAGLHAFNTPTSGIVTLVGIAIPICGLIGAILVIIEANKALASQSNNNQAPSQQF